jgi:hypothetical protein
MRKYLILAMAAIACMAVTSVAQADQTITGSVKPSKLDKKKKKNATLVIDIRTTDKGTGTNSEQPADADRTVVDFPKNLSFDPKAVPNCEGTESELQGTSTAVATDICGSKSIVSVGGTISAADLDPAGGNRVVKSSVPTGAVVTIDANPVTPGSSQTFVPVTVTAFNGTENNVLYLHSRPATLPVTNVLVGKLLKGKGKFGNRLDVTIPQLLAGGISDFKTTVKNGKYVQAVCKTTKMPYAATTTYSDAPQTTGTFNGKCKQKKSKKK